jgi:hypothetical protein
MDICNLVRQIAQNTDLPIGNLALNGFTLAVVLFNLTHVLQLTKDIAEIKATLNGKPKKKRKGAEK